MISIIYKQEQAIALNRIMISFIKLILVWKFHLFKDINNSYISNYYIIT